MSLDKDELRLQLLLYSVAQKQIMGDIFHLVVEELDIPAGESKKILEKLIEEDTAEDQALREKSFSEWLKSKEIAGMLNPKQSQTSNVSCPNCGSNSHAALLFEEGYEGYQFDRFCFSCKKGFDYPTEMNLNKLKDHLEKEVTSFFNLPLSFIPDEYLCHDKTSIQKLAKEMSRGRGVSDEISENINLLKHKGLFELFKDSASTFEAPTMKDYIADLKRQSELMYFNEKGVWYYDSIMVDIETLGTSPGDVILSVAAVEFNIENGSVGEMFFAKIDLTGSLKDGFNIKADTLDWWLKQSQEAKIMSLGEGTPVFDVLSNLESFFRKRAGHTVWGNSNRFDLGLLAAYFKKYDIAIPWDFRLERDVRTLVSFAPKIKDSTPFEGTPHNPVDDCSHQIKYCTKIYKKFFERVQTTNK